MALDPKAVKQKRGMLAAAIGALAVVGLSFAAIYAVWIRPGATRTPPAPEVKAEQPAPTPDPAAAPSPEPTPAAANPAVNPKAPAQGKSAPKPSPVSPPKSAPAAAPVKAANPAPAAAPAAAPKPATPPPPDPAVLISEGLKAFNEKRPDAALAAYRQAKQAQPGNPDLGYLMGIALEQTGELEAALDSFESCTSGNYAAVSQSHVKRLKKKLKRK